MATVLEAASISSLDDNEVGESKKYLHELTPSNEANDKHNDVEKAERRTAPGPDIDWDGPNDPENPLNWLKWKRIYHIIPPAIISFSA